MYVGIVEETNGPVFGWKAFINHRFDSINLMLSHERYGKDLDVTTLLYSRFFLLLLKLQWFGVWLFFTFSSSIFSIYHCWNISASLDDTRFVCPYEMHLVLELLQRWNVVDPGVLPPLPAVTVSEGQQVIASIRYQTSSGVITVNWCPTCHFYRYFWSICYILDLWLLIIAILVIIV